MEHMFSMSRELQRLERMLIALCHTLTHSFYSGVITGLMAVV